MTFPVLYKKTSTGAIQYWHICVLETPNSGTFYDIVTEYGQVGTKSPQITLDTITKGKNIGKKNETRVFEQAELEAKAKWQKQKKKGYVESIEAAQSEKVDELIEGGIVPMLAHSFADHGHKIKYPCYVQPKLDGIRCIAIVKDGKCQLWSRTRKRITSMPHIEEQISKVFRDGTILDGELYSDKFKDNFEHIVHLVRQEEPDPDHMDVEYHIYDLVEDKVFSDRYEMLNKTFGPNYPKGHSLKLVPTQLASTERDVYELFDLYKKSGYEGAMVRNSDGPYVNKRSYDLLKVKELQDSEFEIIGVEEGRGKLLGHCGAFRCKTADGKEFLAKMSGDTDKLIEYLANPSLYIGRMLTVQYQGLTGKEKVPRFPVGLRIRDIY